MGELVLGRPIETVAAARRPRGTRSEADIAMVTPVEVGGGGIELQVANGLLK